MMSNQEVAGRSYSLVHALQEIACDAGYSIDGDDLAAALGLSFMVCAAPGVEDDLAVWPMYGRDAFLIEAGRLFGLGLREIHPPEAACGIDGFAAFRQHFDASYRPLIERALEHDQPVLAWRGWPGEWEAAWGIIRRVTDRGVGVAGVVVTSAEAANLEEMDLVSPPAQLYVVETVAPTEPSADEVMSSALEHARAVLGGEPGAHFGVAMGLAAYDAWIDRLGELDSANAQTGDLGEGHAALAASVVAGHQFGIRFLKRRLERAAPDLQSLITTVTASCHKIITALSMSLDPAAPRTMLRAADGQAKAAGPLADAREAAADMRHALELHAESKEISGDA